MDYIKREYLENNSLRRISGIVYTLEPLSNSALKRVIKTPMASSV